MASLPLGGAGGGYSSLPKFLLPVSVLNIQKTFAARLSTIIVLMVAIIFAAIFIVLSIYTQKVVKRSAEEQSQKALAANVVNIRQMLLQTENTLHEAEWMVYRYIDTPDSLYLVTQHILQENPIIVGSCVALVPENDLSKHQSFAPYSCVVNKEIVNKQLGTEEYDYVNKDWYKNVISTGKMRWSEPYFDKGGIEKQICTLSSPLLDRDGSIFAVLTADISLEWLTDMVNDELPFDNAYGIIINKIGTYVIHPKKERITEGNIFDTPENVNNTKVQEFAREMISGKAGHTEIKENGERYFICYAPINQTSWNLALVCPHNDIFYHYDRLRLFLVIGLILCLVLLSAVCIFIIHRVTRPLTEFSAAALRISQGYFNIALPEIKVHDEIWELRESLDQMQYNLSRYTNRLKEVSANQATNDRDIYIASKIQMSILPPTLEKMAAKMPCGKQLTESLDVAASLLPQQSVGGDFYDYQIVNDNFVFCIGDVSGKGIPASIIMSATVELFRSQARMGQSPAELLYQLNSIASENNEQNMFSTVFVGSINLTTGLLTYCNAGHNPPLIVGVDESVQMLPVDSNLPLGIDKNYIFTDQTLQLHLNNILLLYTDGVTEVEDDEKQQFGEEGLKKVVENNINTYSKKIIEEIIKASDSFRAMSSPSDDFTLLAIRFLKKSEKTSAETDKSLVESQEAEVKSQESKVEGQELNNPPCEGGEIDFSSPPVRGENNHLADYSLPHREGWGGSSPQTQKLNDDLLDSDPVDFTDHISLQNQTTQIRILERFVQSIADYFKISDELTNKINMALEEAVVNIINYAYPAGGDHQFSIDVEHRANLQLLSFIITDDGIPFNPFEQDAPDITLSAADRPIGGLGIHIIRETTSRYSYDYKDKKNVLTLSFKLI